MVDHSPQPLLQRGVLGVLHVALFFVVALFPTYQMATLYPDNTVHYTFLFLVAAVLGLYWLAATEARLPAAAGALVGALVGFLFRPAAPETGQLPFSTVITRGATSLFEESDPAVVAVAQSSFNMVIAGAVIGVLTGVGLSVLAARRARSGA